VVEERYTIKPLGGRGNAPAEEFEVLAGPDQDSWAEPVGRLGIIASVTRPFCRTCDRLRLTADGQLRTCLFAQAETDLRAPLRNGASDDELAEIITAAVADKQEGHSINSASFVQPIRTMSAIGG
jgi:cyclic pyranopterin phosphate synthase